MEMETMSSVVTCSKDDDDDVPLPGFRFHPTDEELVGFYLKRKVEKRPISIELIRQIDIYKFDPWDLPKASNVGDKEWYFFCKRGRKYRNSIRPNRVTGSGFWKATGIDRPIYSAGGEGRDCIGLKKSLVYYRGSAGKGTKTDWMMHEFRLPSEHEKTNTKHIDAKNIAQEAEVWTLCRIFKRNVSYRKCIPDWKDLSGSKKSASAGDAASKTCSMESSDQIRETNYISFSSPAFPAAVNNNFRVQNNIDRKPFDNHHHGHVDIPNQMLIGQRSASVTQAAAPSNITAPHHHASLASSSDLNELLNLKHGDWDELRSMFEFGSAM